MYAHLYDERNVKNYKRGEDYVNFRPDRVAMQDATAQMALLQFMNSGRNEAAVPSTVHCDHLIQAYKGAKEDIATATKTNEEVYRFLRDVSSRYGIGFLAARSRHHSSGRTGKLRFSGRHDDRHRFPYSERRWFGHGGYRRWRCRCGGCDDRHGVGTEDAPA